MSAGRKPKRDQTRRTTVEQELSAIMGYPDFERDLILGLDAQRSADEKASESSRRAAFQAMCDRVSRRAETHRRREIWQRAVTDASDLTREEMFGFLDFMYSCLVSHFKGEIAEILARPIVNDLAQRLGAEIRSGVPLRVVPGHTIRERQSRSDHWKKGADAILLVQDGSQRDSRIHMAAAVEIKSSRIPMERGRKQLEGHLTRLRCGLLIDDREFPPESIQLLDSVSRDLHPATRRGRPRAATLLIRPCIRSGDARTLEPADRTTWLAELPYSSSDLIEGAFRLAEWFLLEGSLFKGPQHTHEKDASRQQTAVDVLRESLHYFSRRDALLYSEEPPPERSPRDLRRRRTFLWFYNSLCYGHDRATGDVMQFPEDHPDLPRAYRENSLPAEGEDLEARISVAHRHYARDELAEAKNLLGEVRLDALSAEQRRRVDWLEGMIAYREGRDVNAFHVFPGPRSGVEDFWWTRDTVMSARLHARAGQWAEARAILKRIGPRLLQVHRALPVEYHAVMALAWALEGRHEEAAVEVDTCTQTIERLRAEVRERGDRGLDPPGDVRASTVRMGILDLVVALVAMNRADEAVGQIHELPELDQWEKMRLAADPIAGTILKPVLSLSPAEW